MANSIVKRIMWSSLAIVVILLVIGCAKTTTSIVSVIDENYGNARYEKILIVAPYENLEIRDNVENLFTANISQRPVIAYKGIDVLPPLKTYTNEEIAQKISDKDIDAILVVAVTDFWTDYQKITSDVEVTNSNTTTKSSTSLNKWSKLLAVTSTSNSEGTSVTHTISGITLSKSNVQLDVRMFVYNLHDSPMMVWRASSTTSGNFFATKSKVMADAAIKVANRLITQGLIEYPENVLPRD